MPSLVRLLPIFLVLPFVACSTIYYSVWEALGQEKRDLLRDNVESVREDQEEVSEQFESALERVRSLYGIEGGELEKSYDALSEEYERSVTKADGLRDRIVTVNEIASDLFNEWRAESAEISDPNLQRRSREQLRATQQRFDRLSAALAKSERSMEPVLQKLKDQVLFLKHNLNAQAVGSLEVEGADIEREVRRLIEDLQSSIRQTEAFIRELPE